MEHEFKPDDIREERRKKNHMKKKTEEEKARDSMWKDLQKQKYHPVYGKYARSMKRNEDGQIIIDLTPFEEEHNSQKGKTKIVFDDGPDLIWEGEIYKEKPDGIGRLFMTDGKIVFEGYMRNSMDGVGVLYAMDGTPVYEGQVYAWLPNGWGAEIVNECHAGYWELGKIRID